MIFEFPVTFYQRIFYLLQYWSFAIGLLVQSTVLSIYPQTTTHIYRTTSALLSHHPTYLKQHSVPSLKSYSPRFRTLADVGHAIIFHLEYPSRHWSHQTQNMDFITLANTAHDTSRSLLRILTETSGEDDDFAHLENSGHATGADHTMAAQDSIGSNAGGADMNRPLLSPTAEAALLELSTNFLLCKWTLGGFVETFHGLLMCFPQSTILVSHLTLPFNQQTQQW